MDERIELTSLVKQAARDQGFELVGVCDAGPPRSFEVFEDWLDSGHQAEMAYLPKSRELRSDPSTLLPGVRSVLAVGLFYGRPGPVEDEKPLIAAYARGRDYHKVLRSKLRKVAESLQSAEPTAGVRITVDSAPVLEREYANRAGLGWFGKNTCLIDSTRGSLFVIGLLLTTAKLKPDAPAQGGCGTCRACIDACPTGAIVPRGDGWQVDARRCISYLTIEHRGPVKERLRAQIGDWTFGCDVCQAVCPFNMPRPSQPMRAPDTACPDFTPRLWPDLERLAVVSKEEWDDLTRGSPVRRAGWEGLRRNVRTNLDNRASRNGEPPAESLPEGPDQGLDVLR
ncbi:MAG: tRNA epoxyqueuosine(34) reductase QueG [Armatimonadetes bacterium]|nr:tRNA epoxyqueuosine(34) reductase QueG [Armatimonadota bacterium]